MRSEICISLGVIGDNTNGDVLRGIIYVYRQGKNMNSKFVISIITSLEKLSKSSQASFTEVSYILKEIEMSGSNSEIRDFATETLKRLE